MNNVVVLTPTTGTCKMKYAFSMANMAARTPNFQLLTAEGCLISDSREKMVRKFLQDRQEITHALFIDDDMEFPPDSLEKLLSHELDIVGANYPKRMPGQGFSASVKTTNKSQGLEECSYLGFGLCLIKREVFEKFGMEPMFPLMYANGRYQGEDVAFFARARSFGYIAHIDHDLSKRVTHWGSRGYTWYDHD